MLLPLLSKNHVGPHYIRLADESPRSWSLSRERDEKKIFVLFSIVRVSVFAGSLVCVV